MNNKLVRQPVLAAICLSLSASGSVLADECLSEWDPAFGVPGMSAGVFSFTAHDDGDGERLVAGGNFTSAGGTAANRVAMWDGTSWSPLGVGMNSNEVYALASFDGDLYAGGYFNQAGGESGTAKLARWDGTQWNSIDAQLELWSNQLWALNTFDDGSGEALYIGGNFADIGGVTGASYLARWDGESFSTVGSPIAGQVPLIIYSIESWDDGNGEAMYVGGRFTSIDGVPASRIAKWDGKQWSALGDGVTGAGVAPSINDMVAFDDGTGEALYVGGQAFTSAGGHPANRVAKWDGSQWSAVGDGFADGIVWDLEVFDDGSGPALYAFGTFTMSGTTPISSIARWNGNEWEQVGEGADGSIYASIIFDDGSGEAMYIGANGMTSIDGVDSNNIARYGCTRDDILGDLNGDGSVDVSDMLMLLGDWGVCADPKDCPADLNGSGSVDVSDLLMLLGNWG